MELPNEINPRIAVFVFLFIVMFIGIFYGSYIFKLPIFPQKEVKMNITPNVTIIYKTIEKLVTPTPDGHIYFASEYQNGTRLLQRPFSWIRENVFVMQNSNSTVNYNYNPDNLTFNKSNPELRPDTQDMKVTIIVYDYKIFSKLHAFNPDDYKYDEILPTTGNKFLFVFAYVFMDDIIGDDTRMWMFNRSAFAVYDGNQTFRPINYPLQYRFKELEQTPTFDKSEYVQAFKSIRDYDFQEEYFNSAGEHSDEIYYLRGGKSNAVDGYLIYEIPEKDRPENLTVLGKFYVFGWSNWILRA